MYILKSCKNRTSVYENVKTIAYKIKWGDLIGGGKFNKQMACLQNRARTQVILQTHILTVTQFNHETFGDITVCIEV